jgi:hypothetical protein
MDYNFVPRDLTEGGTNNAVIVDFLSHEGTELPTYFRVFALASPSDSFVSFSNDLHFSADRFSIAFLFTEFSYRGGPPAMPDFSTIRRIFVDFYFLNGTEEISWSAQVDRIRIGRMPVPEPSSIAVGTAGFLFLVSRYRARSHTPRFNGGLCDVNNSVPESAHAVDHRFRIAPRLGD